MNVLPALIGGLGLFMQNEANNDAQSSANAAQASQDQLAQRQIALFDRIQQRYNELRDSGAFSPEARIRQLNEDTAKYESTDSGNLAGAFRTSGYNPGDSELATRLDSVKMKYRGARENAANQIRREATNDELAAMQGQQSGASGLAGLSAMFGDRASAFGSQIRSLSPAVMGLGSGLSQLFGKGAPTGNMTATAPLMQSGNRLGTGGYMDYQQPQKPQRMTLSQFRNMRYSA